MSSIALASACAVGLIGLSLSVSRLAVTFEEFKKIIRTGVDMDHLHPTRAPNQADTSHCVPPPFDGRFPHPGVRL